MRALSCDEVRELAAAYVLNGLNATDSAAVRAHLDGHWDAHPEFAELGAVAPALAYLTDPISPPPALKARVLAAAATTPQLGPAREAGEGVPFRAAPAVASVANLGHRAPIGRDRGWRAALRDRRAGIARWTFAAAAIVSIVALLFANASLQNDVSSARQFSDQLHRAMTLAATPGSRLAIIETAGASGGSAGPRGQTGPTGLAAIPRVGPGVLVMQGLGATSGAQVYEAWAIVGNQAPAPIGSFSVGGDGYGWLAELVVPAGGDIVVALTREPGPGATKPTLPIVAAGTTAPRL